MSQIIHGDFFEELPKIRVNTAGMILTDLPYNITANSWECDLDLREMWNLFHHVLKDTGVICLTAVQPFTSKLVLSNLKEYKHEWIWHKDRGSNFMNTVREPMKEHESVLVFSKGNWVYNMIKQDRAESKQGKRNLSGTNAGSTNYGKFKTRDRYVLDEKRVPSSVQKFNHNTGLHPTQKPVKLFEYLIKTYSNEGETILDCCAGSGTAAMACINTNRNYICIEKEEKYYAIINDRIARNCVKKETV